MPISSVGPSSYPPAGMTVSSDKAAPAEKAASPAASAPEAAKAASSAPNMFKINPDGTVGPMHVRRHPNAPGVTHA